MASGLEKNEIAQKWPLHWMVWNNDHKALKRVLGQQVYDKEAKDPRGRTPLHLAVSLCYRDCMEVLMYHGASTLALNRHQWSVFQEAVCTGNKEIVNMTSMIRDDEKSDQRARELPLLLERLQSAPDFYAEMKWEFTTWIPFLSRVCPSDTYKIWKKGGQVRVDTSLIGFDNMQWIRGNQSFVFNVTAEGAKFIEIDHDKKLVWEHPVQLVCKRKTDPVKYMAEHNASVMRRLISPVVSTAFDTNSIEFQRQKSGIWGFRSDRTEVIEGHDSKVFSACGLELMTRTRVDHLPAEERQKHKEGGANPLQSFLGIDGEIPSEGSVPGGGVAATNMLLGNSTVIENSTVPRMSVEEYFTSPQDPKEYDAIGRPVEVYSRVQSLKATVWLADNHTLSLQDQIMPVIDLMAVNNAHFAKLKDFITLQMPAGFPVKFEIPLFHLMSARVTFGNINGVTQSVPHVSLQGEEVPVVHSQPAQSFDPTTVSSQLKRRHTGSSSSFDSAQTTPTVPHPHDPINPEVTRCRRCLVKDDAFKIDDTYRRPGQWRGGTLADEEEELLQMAIRQSLLEHESAHSLTTEGGSHDEESIVLTEALKDETIMSSINNDTQYSSPLAPYAVGHTPSAQNDLELAMALSRAQALEDEERRERERREDEELERILKLSLEEQ